MTLRDLTPWRQGRRRSYPNPFNVLREEMSGLFEDFFREFDLEPFGEGRRMFSPRVDVSESEKEITVSAELPGLEEKDIDVSITKDALTVRGEKKDEREEKNGGRYHAERFYGAFSRTIPLPAEIDRDAVKATYKKGVLTMRLPKTAAIGKETRKVKVLTG
jgi:HSP20 family protein